MRVGRPQPGWLPRRLRTAVVALIALSVAGFLIDGADRPANPYLGAAGAAPASTPSATSSGTVFIPPGQQVHYGTASISVTPGPGLRRPEPAPCVLVASSPAAQAEGLMYRSTIAPYAGMAFVFSVPSTAEFYMKDTPLTLDIAWFDATGAYLSSTTMTPCHTEADCPTYGPGRNFSLALEVPGGKLRSLGIGPGSSLQLGSGCT